MGIFNKKEDNTLVNRPPQTDNLQNALKENQKLRETEEKIRRVKEAKEKAENEKREKMARKKQLVDLSKDDDQVCITEDAHVA